MFAVLAKYDKLTHPREKRPDLDKLEELGISFQIPQHMLPQQLSGISQLDTNVVSYPKCPSSTN